MRIVKHGDSANITRYTCDSCGCVFEVNANKSIKKKHYTHDTYDRPMIICPDCGGGVYIIDKMVCLEPFGEYKKGDILDISTGFYSSYILKYVTQFRHHFVEISKEDLKKLERN